MFRSQEATSTDPVLFTLLSSFNLKRMPGGGAILVWWFAPLKREASLRVASEYCWLSWPPPSARHFDPGPPATVVPL